MRRRVSIPLATALLALALIASPVAAATVNVSMDAENFLPRIVTAKQGDTVRWTNPIPIEHDVIGNPPLSYFTSPDLDYNDTWSRTFKAAGAFGYYCSFHEDANMVGTIKVPIKGAKFLDNGTTKFRITVASESLPSGSAFVYVVERDTPTGSWEYWKTTRSRQLVFAPTTRGTYRFRSKVQRVSNGATSGVSPIKSLTY